MRLSEFKDEKAIQVVADLLVPIQNIVSNPETTAAKENGGTMLNFAAALLKNNKRDIMDMLAILDDKDPEEYHCTAATVLFDVLNMLGDPDLMQLFGLQSKTAASSGSVSENIEGHEN